MRKRVLFLLLTLCLVFGGCENKNSELYQKGMEALEKQDYVMAEAMLKGAVKAGERLPESYRALGISYLKSGAYEDAAKAFADSRASMKYKNREFSHDVSCYEAEAWIEAGNLDQAIKVCETVNEEKKDADALFLMGRAYFLQKEYEKAAEAFDSAVQVEHTVQLCLDIYEFYQESSRKADGDVYLEKAEEIKPESAEDYFQLGMVEYYLEKPEKAVKMLQKATDEGNVSAMEMIGQIYLEDGKTKEAEDFYQSYLNQTEFAAAAYNGLATCALARNDTDMALSYLSEGLKVVGEKEKNVKENLLFNEITAYEKRGDFEKAKSLVSSFLETYPENAAAQKEKLFLQSR